jgi:hypothetical protein
MGDCIPRPPDPGKRRFHARWKNSAQPISDIEAGEVDEFCVLLMHYALPQANYRENEAASSASLFPSFKQSACQVALTGLPSQKVRSERDYHYMASYGECRCHARGSRAPANLNSLQGVLAIRTNPVGQQGEAKY